METENEKLDRRKVRTRQLLRESLLALILEKGYNAITIQDITDHANLGRATFYLHYNDKDELLVNTLEALFDPLVKQMLEVRGEFLTGKRPVSQMAFEHVQQHHALYRALLTEDGVAFVVRRVRQYLATATQHIIETPGGAVPSASIPMEVIASHLAGSLMSLIIWWLENDMPHPPEEMSDMFHRLALPGVYQALGLPFPA
jgi:AcrR family transcriptional regulator